MFKTRNLAVMAVIVSAGALGAVAATSSMPQLLGGQTAGLGFVEGAEIERGAVLATVDEPSRESRLEALKKKIAKSDLGVFIEEVVQTEEDVASTEETTEQPSGEEVVDIGEQRCAAYQVRGGAWSIKGVLIDEVEGARLVYREKAAASSTTPPTREILAELPLRSLPSAATHCIGTDVIGIANNGALIRNNELIAYQGYSLGQLVGYALDGFPIYGAGAQKTDSCGGTSVSGQYRYVLSAKRDVMINCFASAPISL